MNKLVKTVYTGCWDYTQEIKYELFKYDKLVWSGYMDFEVCDYIGYFDGQPEKQSEALEEEEHNLNILELVSAIKFCDGPIKYVEQISKYDARTRESSIEIVRTYQIG